MKFKQTTGALALSIFLSVSLQGLRSAHGELVFENDLNSAPQKQASEETNSERGRVAERSDLSRSEMMRRQRLREELKNEDMLTQKLEELRLRDEMKRTGEIIGSGTLKTANTEAPPATSPLSEQKVGSAAQASVPSASSQMAGPVSMNGAPVDAQASAASTLSLSEELKKNSDVEESGKVSISPRGGISSITNSTFDIEAKFAAGLNISVDLSEYFAFSGSYSYSKYRLGAGRAIYYPTGFNTSYLQQLNLNDNVIDVGIKGYFLGTKAKARPFIGGGVGYRRGYVNYDDRTLSYLRQYSPNMAQDITISGFSAYVETGVEFKITKSIALTGTFRYFNTLSHNQSNPIDPYAFVNPNYYGYGMTTPYYGGLVPGGAFGYNSDQRAQASDALSRNNFYQILAGVSISF